MKDISKNISFAKQLLNDGYKNELDFFLKKEFNKNNDSELKKLQNLNQKKIIVSIHQPAYFGWSGYFHKIYYSDKFTILENTPISKSSYLNRSEIQSLGSKKYLTLPIKNKNSTTLIKDLKTDENQDWRKKHLSIIYNNYRSSKFFKDYYSFIEDVFESTKNKSFLLDITTIITTSILNFLNIKKELTFSSQLEINEKYKKDQRNYKIVNKLNGNIYFSGITAKEYQKSDEVPNDLLLIYQDFWNYFDLEIKSKNSNLVNGSSIIDLLFVLGKSQIIDIYDKYVPYNLKKQELIFNKKNF